MIKQLPLIMPPGLQHYDCTNCGDCCRGRFAIIITKEDRDRIAAQNWSGEELGLNGKPLFTPRGDGFQLAHRDNGSCVFLQDNNLCRIHAQHGEAAKPLACRLYPFTFVPLGNEVRVDVRFDCPATAGNLGRPIPAHRTDLLELVKNAVPDQAAGQPAPRLTGTVQPTWAQLCRITECFERVLLDISLDITRRVTACVNLADLLRQTPFITLSGRALGEFLDDAAAHVQEAAVLDSLERTMPHGSQLLAFRQLIGLYGRIDQVGERANLLRRLTNGWRMLSGKGQVPPLREGFPEVGFSDIENARGAPTPDAARALERYLHVHLTSMGFFGPSFYGRSYLDGLNALLLTYPLICWFARAFALAEGLASPDASCIERSLMIVDHQHGVTPALNLPTERYRANFLSERNTLRSLIIWYGS